MSTKRTRRVFAASSMLAAVAMAGSIATAYVVNGKWSSKSVTYYVNPNNLDVSADAAEAATQWAASAWTNQSQANFQFAYGGRTNETSTGADRKNVVIFRNASNGGALATTYTWYSGGSLIDADIIVWDGAYQFYTESGTCSGGAYIQDVLTHEFGHALGLAHSTVGDATMYPYYSYCSEEMRSLAADDIAGVQSMYPPSSQQTNTAPSVTISSPSSGTSVTQGTSVTFAGSASDNQDGNLSGNMQWTSSADGPIGSGATFSTSTLSVGTHTVSATVTDSGSLTSSTTVTVYVTAATAPPQPPPSGSNQPLLTGKGYKMKGMQRTDLSWSGFDAATIDIYRDGSKIKTTSNDGGDTDAINKRGGGSYTYRACDVGTTTCSNDVTVVF